MTPTPTEKIRWVRRFHRQPSGAGLLVYHLLAVLIVIGITYAP